jgi:hypothetical protein
MVLAGKTLSPASHCWDVGDHAPTRALRAVTTGPRCAVPIERTGRPKWLAGQANSAEPRAEMPV